MIEEMTSVVTGILLIIALILIVLRVKGEKHLLLSGIIVCLLFLVGGNSISTWLVAFAVPIVLGIIVIWDSYMIPQGKYETYKIGRVDGYTDKWEERMGAIEKGEDEKKFLIAIGFLIPIALIPVFLAIIVPVLIRSFLGFFIGIFLSIIAYVIISLLMMLLVGKRISKVKDTIKTF